MDDKMELRKAVAAAKGFGLYEQYPEKQAAHILGKNLTTLKKWRAKGYVPYVKIGERGVRYWGYAIADMLIYGIKEQPWQDTPNAKGNVETTGYPNGVEVPRGAGRGLTPKPDRPNEYHLAQAILGKPKSS